MPPRCVCDRYQIGGRAIRSLARTVAYSDDSVTGVPLSAHRVTAESRLAGSRKTAPLLDPPLLPWSNVCSILDRCGSSTGWNRARRRWRTCAGCRSSGRWTRTWAARIDAASVTS